MTDKMMFTLLAIGAAILFIALLLVFYFISKKISDRYSGLEDISKKWLIRIPFSMFTSFWTGTILVIIWWLTGGNTKFSGGGEGQHGVTGLVYYAGFILLSFLLLLLIKKPKIHLFLIFTGVFIYTVSMIFVSYKQGFYSL